MNKTILLFAAAIAVGAFVARGHAQDPVPGSDDPTGAWPSHLTEERIDVSVGVTQAGDYLQLRRYRELRETVVVPEHFGNLVGVTQSGTRTVLWYSDQQNVVRNVAVDGADTRLYRVEKNGSNLVEEIRTSR